MLTPRAWAIVGIEIVAILAYFALLDGGRRGQTIGKTVTRIAVRSIDDGGPLGVGRALIRQVVFVGLFFVFFLGVIDALSPLWDPRRQAWHDKVVASSVVEIR